MLDEIFDRHYRAGRSQMNASLTAGLASFGRAVAKSFEVLNRIEYQAPWSTPARRTPCN